MFFLSHRCFFSATGVYITQNKNDAWNKKTVSELVEGTVL
jgi:hypothetical protein